MSIPQNTITLDLGCGPKKAIPEAIGVELRHYDCVDVRADVIHLPFTNECAKAVYARSILEHFKNPYPFLEEVYRVMSSTAFAEFIVPNFGTYSSDSDPSHLFVTDLVHWCAILGSFFQDITAKPVGVKFQASTHKWILKQIELIMDGLYDLAQGFTFVCLSKQPTIVYHYVTDYMEDFAREMQREFVVPREASENPPRAILRIDFSLYREYLPSAPTIPQQPQQQIQIQIKKEV